MSAYTLELDRAVCAHAGRLYRRGGPLSREDVRQIGRLAACEAIPRHEGRCPLVFFVLRAVRWRVAGAYERAGREVPVEAGVLEAGVNAQGGSPDVARQVVVREVLQGVLEGLSVEDRLLLLPFPEGGREGAAERAGLGVDAFKWRRHRLLSRIRAEFREAA